MNNIVYAGKPDGQRDFNALKFTQIILTSQNGELLSDGTTSDYRAGDIIVVPPLAVWSRTGAGDGDICVLLDKALLPVKEPIILHDDGERGITHALRQAETYYRSAITKKQNILDGLGSLLAGYITAFSEIPEYSPIVASVRAEIDKRLSDSTFRLDDYLRKLPLNYDYVRKLFKKETGATPHAYLLSARMELAKTIILSGLSNRYSKYTVSQLAEACGFSEPLYFSRVFKKYYGVSPSEYGLK